MPNLPFNLPANFGEGSTAEGTASGGYSWAGTATGQRQPGGTGAGTYSWAGTATGQRQPGGAAGGGYAWAGAASGARASQGTGSGGYSWAGTATGKREPKGHNSSTYGWPTRVGYCQSEIAHPTWFTEAEIRAQLQGIVDIGGTHVRMAAWWLSLQPTAGAPYEWTGPDRAMNLCQEYGLIPLVVITNPAPTGVTVANYGALCGAIAARYGAAGTNQLHHYEVWNEINHTDFADPFDGGPEAYVELLAAASTAIRAADSQAFIVSVGLMATADFDPDGPGGNGPTDIAPTTFTQGIYDHGGAPYFDALGFHWYLQTPDFSSWVPPAVDEFYYLELLGCRTIMVAEGDAAKQIWVTEVGLPEPILTGAVRAERLTTQLQMLEALPWIGCWFIYNYRCTGSDFGELGNQFGVALVDNSRRQPTWDALATFGPATGESDHGGAGGGGYAWAGTATGAKSAAGTASGTYSWAGTALGGDIHVGTASGTYSWAGTATGDSDPLGAAGGTYSWAGTAAGERDTTGVGGGGYSWAGAAVGAMPGTAEGTAGGGYGWVAEEASGIAPGQVIWPDGEPPQPLDIEQTGPRPPMWSPAKRIREAKGRLVAW